MPTGKTVVIDSISTCEAHDAKCAPRYHWIEEGTYEDFRRNIMESDLPVPFDFPSFDFNATGFALMGTVTGRTFVNREVLEPEPEPMALMGTHIWQPAALYAPGDVVHYNGHQHAIIMDTAKVDQSVLAMLMARPEMTRM